MPRKIKRKSSGSRMGGGGMLQQLQSLQEEMLKAQDEVTSMVVTATAGGAVTATVTGEKRVQSITIDPEVIDPDDVEMLQDLVVAAVNSGLEQIDAAMTEKMQPFTGGLDIPGV